jgi:hypothetical protein
MMIKLRVWTVSLAILCIAILSWRSLEGQAVTGSLVGTVTDQTGAILPGASVSITNQGTGASNNTLTNDSGNYDLPFLSPGTYTVSVSAAGFEKNVTSGVDVPVNTTTRIDVSLQPGSTSETINVTDQAPMMQTDRADVSAQIEAKQVLELPVGNSQNFQELESLIPGVSAPIYDHSTFDDAQNSESFDVNGQSELSNNLQLEGVDDNERTGLLQVYIPPAAAIQTVDVETSNYAPEFGRSAGAVTNVILKSGTNNIHGSAYEFNQISAIIRVNFLAILITTMELRSVVHSSKTVPSSSRTFCEALITRVRTVWRLCPLLHSVTAIYQRAQPRSTIPRQATQMAQAGSSLAETSFLHRASRRFRKVFWR